MPKWRNRETRYVQGVVPARACGFKSHLRHHTKEQVAGNQEQGQALPGSLLPSRARSSGGDGEAEVAAAQDEPVGSRARSSVWIERSPAEAEVVGSSPAERAKTKTNGGRYGALGSTAAIALLRTRTCSKTVVKSLRWSSGEASWYRGEGPAGRLQPFLGQRPPPAGSAPRPRAGASLPPLHIPPPSAHPG